MDEVGLKFLGGLMRSFLEDALLSVLKRLWPQAGRSPLIRRVMEVIGAVLLVAAIVVLFIHYWVAGLVVLVPFAVLLICARRAERRADQRYANRPPLDDAVRRRIDER